MTKPQLISITGRGGHLGTCLIKLSLDQSFSVKALFINSGMEVKIDFKGSPFIA